MHFETVRRFCAMARPLALRFLPHSLREQLLNCGRIRGPAQLGTQRVARQSFYSQGEHSQMIVARVLRNDDGQKDRYGLCVRCAEDNRVAAVAEQGSQDIVSAAAERDTPGKRDSGGAAA
jgi:hypothetical protein